MAFDVPVAADAGGNGSGSPLRLLWLIDSLTMGGAEALTLSFAREAKRRGIELVVCSRTSIDGNAIEDEIRSAGVEVVNLGSTRLIDFAAFRRLRRLVRERGINVIHAHLAYASIWGAWLARTTALPMFATIHVVPEEESDVKELLRRWLLYKLLNRHARRVVAVSNDLRRQMLKTTTLDPARFVVVHNGVDVPDVDDRNAVRERVREELGVRNDELLFCSVAVLREGKGIDVLIRAIASQPIDGRFLIVGDGPKREEWQRLAMSAKVSDKVIWAGFRRDIADLLLASDVFVHPTLADAFPTVLLEAMGAGLPVIASAAGGVPEIVERRTGLLVPPGDAAALGRAMEVAADARWRAVAGEAARTRVQQEFSTSAWVDRLLRLYEISLETRR